MILLQFALLFAILGLNSLLLGKQEEEIHQLRVENRILEHKLERL